MSKTQKFYDYDLLINGAGIAGLSMALAAAQIGLSVGLIDRNSFDNPPPDGRAYALTPTSLNLFENLGLEHLLGASLPVEEMRIDEAIAGTGAGTGAGTDISPHSLNVGEALIKGPLAYMVESSVLVEMLRTKVSQDKNIKILAPATLVDFKMDAGTAEVTLDDGTAYRAPLAVAADGGKSALRSKAGIDVSRSPYGQSVLVVNVEFEKPHGNIAWQTFYSGGPLAVLPLTDNRAQIPWFDSHKAVKAGLALSEDDFNAELSRRLNHRYGKITLLSKRHSYPLALQMAESYFKGRVALIGDAAHQIHPLVGQGLNLGLRDVATLAEVLRQAKATGQDLGGPVLAEYGQWRGTDSRMLAMSTDILARGYGLSKGPMAHIRRLGIGIVNRSDRVKSLLAKEAAGPTGDLPPLLKRAS